MITYGTNPGMGMPITARMPDPSTVPIRSSANRSRRRCTTWARRRQAAAGPSDRRGLHRKLHQLAHLRSARGRGVLKGRKVSPKVRVMVVPGSQEVKRQAEAEGLTEIFREAGCEWREAGCSMCIAMNGDQLAARPVQRLDQQSQLRRTAGQGRPHVPGEPADRRRQRDHRRGDRREDACYEASSRISKAAWSPLPIDNIDTDQIIPARFLKTTSQGGPRQAALQRLALRRAGQSEARLRV